MNSFDVVVWCRDDCRDDHRLQRRAAPQRRDDPGIPDRHADRGLGYLADHARRRRALALMQNPLPFFGTFLVAGIVLGKLMRMADRRGDWTGGGHRRPLAGSALGAVRVGLVAISVVVDLRPARPGGSPAVLSCRLAAAAAVFGRGTDGSEIPAPRHRGLCRPPENRPADLKSSLVSAMRLAERLVSYQGGLDWLD